MNASKLADDARRVQLMYLVSFVAYLVGRGPRLSRTVSGQWSSHSSDLDVVGLLPRADLAVGVFLGEVIQLIDGGFVVGHERGFPRDVVDAGQHPVGQVPRCQGRHAQQGERNDPVTDERQRSLGVEDGGFFSTEALHNWWD